MTNTEFKAELTKAFKTHMFMKDRNYHTVNELLYVLEHHAGFNGEDFNIAIKLFNDSWTNIPTLDCFVNVECRAIWFYDEYVEFEIEECDGMSFNCITIYESEGED